VCDLKMPNQTEKAIINKKEGKGKSEKLIK
jgi:hypothetical protein